MIKKKIVITGGNGRFAQSLKKHKNKYQLFYPTKQELNILKIKSIKNYLNKAKLLDSYLRFENKIIPPKR